MNDNGATTALAALLDADPDTANRAELGVLVRHARVLRGFVDSFDVRSARRSRQLEAEGTSESAASMLIEEGRRGGKEAQAAADREELCTRMPGFEDALATGAISTDHLDALNRATKGLDDAQKSQLDERAGELVDRACNDYVWGFERHCRSLVKEILAETAEADAQARLDRQRRDSSVRRWTDQATGMHKTLISLDPVRDATWWSAVEAQLATLKQQDGNSGTPFEQLQVDAVVTSATPGTTARRVPEVIVLIDLQTLTDGLHTHSVHETSDGTLLPVSEIRKLCCDADIIPAVLDGDGHTLDIGRANRVATAAQRHALRAMYTTCGHPHCSVPFDQCRIHHITYWRNFGHTNIANLIPVCEKHHHMIHDGGWQLTMTPDRTTTWTRPDGTIFQTGDTTDRQPKHRRREPALC